jgi:hypothetical protein
MMHWGKSTREQISQIVVVKMEKMLMALVFAVLIM